MPLFANARASSACRLSSPKVPIELAITVCAANAGFPNRHSSAPMGSLKGTFAPTEVKSYVECTWLYVECTWLSEEGIYFFELSVTCSVIK